MQNIEIVETFKSECHVNEGAPNGLLFEDSACLLVGHNFLIKISIVKKFHDDAGCFENYHSELASMKECL
jgi:hypothetical protein